MMHRYAGAKKGQTAVELAIFGSLILLAFSSVIMYGQQLAAQQQAKMEAFRRTLQKAYVQNSSVSYNIRRNKHFMNMMGNLYQGSGSTIAGSSTVMWQKGSPGPHGHKPGNYSSYGYYKLDNNAPQELQRVTVSSVNYDGGESESLRPVEVWREATTRQQAYTYDQSKTERGSRIGYRKSAQNLETVNIVASTRINTATDSDPCDDSPPAPVYTDGNEMNLDSGSTITHNSAWSVNND